MRLNVTSYQSIFMGVNTYVLRSEGYALVIDPRPNISGEELGGDALDAILLTHEHFDHICGVEEWRSRYGAPVWAGRDAAEHLMNPKRNMSRYGSSLFEVMYPGDTSYQALGEIRDYRCKADRLLEDGETIVWHGNQLKVLRTPGHSAGSICFLVNEKLLFCGDTMFADLPTGVRWKGSDPAAFHNVTIPMLRELDGDIAVYPGHGERFLMKDYTFWEQTT